MNDATTLALIDKLPSIIAAVGSVVAAIGTVIGVLVSMRNGRKADGNSASIKEIKDATDGMKTDLVAVTKSDFFQKGHTAGITEEKVRAAEAGP